MKTINFHLTPFTLVAVLLLASCGNSQNSLNYQLDTAKAPAIELKSVKDSLSWGYGQYLALALQGEFFDTAFNHDILLEGFAYTLKGGQHNILTPQEAQEIAQYANMYYAALMQRKAKSTAETVDSLQQAFFAQLVKDNPNVKSYQMGDKAFYYEVLTPGKGRKAGLAERIRFDYRSFNLLSGQPIDQTYGNRESIIHVVGSPMFPGLVEAFQLMNAGSIYRFYFPYQLAFGAEGSGGAIPPYTPVIYEIELHEIYDI